MTYCAPTTPDFKLRPKAYRGSHQASVDAGRRAASMAVTRARVSALEARSAGLVSVSTTCKGLSATQAWADKTCITIDPAAARVTRLRKGLGIAAKQLHNLGSRKQQIWMQTLTYAGTNKDWRPEHISRYLDALRRWHYGVTGSKKVRYAWVAELQKRGVIHYHVIVWLEGGLTPPKADTAWKCRGEWNPPMWPHGMSRRDKSTAPVAYLMKYASKVESKEIGGYPHGARIHGAGGLDASGRAIRRWVLWPAYVQRVASVADGFKPAKGGGYRNDATGELLLAEFAPTGAGFKSFIRVRTNARAVDGLGQPYAPCGPFSWAPVHPDSAVAGSAGYFH